MYYVKALLALALAFYFATHPVKSETLPFGKWNLTCSEAGCGGACYIDQRVSDDISTSATYYNGKLAFNIYYTEKYYDVSGSLLIDDQAFPLEKRRQASILKLKKDQANILHEAKKAVLVLGEEQFDLDITDYQKAYKHWTDVQNLN